MVVDSGCEIAVAVRGVGTYGMLQAANCFWRPVMVFATQSVGVVAARVEELFVNHVAAKRQTVPFNSFARDFREPNAANRGMGAEKIILYEAI